ncbi:MAG: BMP family ABC transporter substrate-binding protein [Chloroflexota bacterium]|nr:BMP family ABC transporter substrate-binding protein [Chloroflexota bacterium]
MRTRSLGLTMVAGLAVLLSACTSTGTGSPAATAAPDPCAGAKAGAAHTPPTDWSKAKVGVVTDIGTLNDKNFNEYSFKGAQDGATAIKAAAPQSVVPKDQSEYLKDIGTYVDQGYDIIVTVGFNLATPTACMAKANSGIWFVGVDQSPICVTADGKPDSTFACKGDAATLLPKYISLAFKEDQAGYLAGIVAASLSKNAEIGAIGGTTLCAPCVRYIQGYELGAKSIKPNIAVKTAYVTRDFSAKAFQDQTGGKTFADNFLTTNPKVDVLFQVAGLTGNGVLDSACAKGIYGIGVDVDQFLSYPNADKCLVTSAEKHLEKAVSDAIKGIAGGTAKAGNTTFDATNDGIGVADFHDKASLITAATKTKLADALAAMKAGTLTTCPATGCGVGPK